MTTVIDWLDALRKRLKNGNNPDNLLRINHERDSRRHGDRFGDHSYGRLIIRRWTHDTRLTIGRFCSIADGVTVFLGGNHRIDWASTYPFSDFAHRWPTAAGHPSTLSSRGDVVIGSDVWIGAGATIMSGVTIGNGAVIGTAAVVTKSVPDYAVVAGNPAKVIKMRFSAETIARLLATAWWDRPDSEIGAIATQLQSGDLDGLLERLEVGRP